jgi:Flp pilus assembly protein TadD
VLGARVRAAGIARADAGAALAHEQHVRRANIAFFEARVRRDPAGALDRARLAMLHLAAARASGRFEDLVLAETAARTSLDRRRAHNRGAALVLVNALMGQHRFSEALVEAEQLEQLSPEDPGARSLVGEILLELGRYEEADARFASLGPGTDLSVTARVARWHDLRGRPEQAGAALRQARDRAQASWGLTLEQQAWFELRLAEHALHYGTHRAAQRAVARGLALAPGDHRLLALAAEVALAAGRWDQAAEYAASALEQHFDPATLAILGKAERARGDLSAARATFDAMEKAILAQPLPWHRGWSLALLDEGRHVPAVLAQARADLRERHDAWGWDLLAWALHRAGRTDEARAAMAQALASGTKDPRLLEHARRIREAS